MRKVVCFRMSRGETFPVLPSSRTLSTSVGAYLALVVSGSDKAETSIKHFPIRSAIGESWRRLKAGVIKRRWRRGSVAFPFFLVVSSPFFLSLWILSFLSFWNLSFIFYQTVIKRRWRRGSVAFPFSSPSLSQLFIQFHFLLKSHLKMHSGEKSYNSDAFSL